MEMMAVMVCVFVRVMDKDTCQQDKIGAALRLHMMISSTALSFIGVVLWGVGCAGASARSPGI